MVLRKKLVGGLLVFLAGVLLAGYYSMRKTEELKMGPFPSTLRQYAAIDEQTNWRLEMLQPLVIGYLRIRNGNYAVVLYVEGGEVKRGLVFLTGELGGQQIEKIVWVGRGQEPERLDYRQLVWRMGVGRRVRIEYLSRFAPDWEDPPPGFCEKVFPLCLYPYLTEEQEAILKGAGLIRPDKLMGATVIYEELLTGKER